MNQLHIQSRESLQDRIFVDKNLYRKKTKKRYGDLRLQLRTLSNDSMQFSRDNISPTLVRKKSPDKPKKAVINLKRTQNQGPKEHKRNMELLHSVVKEEGEF